MLVVFMCNHCPYVKHIREALVELLSGSKVVSEQKPSMGCNIKWKQGNEPEYFKI